MRMLAHLISNTGEIMGTEVSYVTDEKHTVKFLLVEDGNLTHALIKIENMKPILLEVPNSAGYMLKDDYVQLHIPINFTIDLKREYVNE